MSKNKSNIFSKSGNKKKPPKKDNGSDSEAKKKVTSRKVKPIDDNLVPCLSVRYKDLNIKLSADRLSAKGHKGWSSVFSTHGASSGKWYYEVRLAGVEERIRFVGVGVAAQRCHFRVGFSCRYQRYDLPVGINAFGVSLSDVDGAIVLEGKKHKYAKPFGNGDIIGCYLSLEPPTTNFDDPRKDLRLYEFIQGGMLCDPKNTPKSDCQDGSYVQFSVNGEMFPRANVAVMDGFYHPAVSLYMGSSASVNFGPDFTHPPPDDFSPCINMTKPLIS